MHHGTATLTHELTSLDGDSLALLFDQQLTRITARLADLPDWAIPETHWGALRNALKSARTLVLTQDEFALLIVIPPTVALYADQMQALTHDGQPGVVSTVTEDFSPTDRSFRPRLPYLYLGVDKTNRGRTPDLAEKAIPPNHRVQLTAEGLIAWVRERGLPSGRELMCFGTCLGQDNPVVLRRDKEPITKRERMGLTFVSRQSDYVQTNWQNYIHPSAQRRIVL